MKTFNYAKILLFLIITLSISSCTEKNYTDDFLRNSNEKLCGFDWIEEYLDGTDNCVHTLYFDRKGGGIEYFDYYRPTSTGWERNPYQTKSANFSWVWINNLEGLKLSFNEEVWYLDNVWVREFYFSANWGEDARQLVLRRADSPN